MDQLGIALVELDQAQHVCDVDPGATFETVHALVVALMTAAREYRVAGGMGVAVALQERAVCSVLVVVEEQPDNAAASDLYLLLVGSAARQLVSAGRFFQARTYARALELECGRRVVAGIDTEERGVAGMADARRLQRDLRRAVVEPWRWRGIWDGLSDYARVLEPDR